MCVRAHIPTYRELALLLPTSSLAPRRLHLAYPHVSGEPWVKDLSTSVEELALIEKANYDKAVGIVLVEI